MAPYGNDESNNHEGVVACDLLRRRDLLKLGITVVGAVSMGAGLNPIAAAAPSDRAPASKPGPASLDAPIEAKKIAFDRIGNGEKVLLISGCPARAKNDGWGLDRHGLSVLARWPAKHHRETGQGRGS
jgi:hypothetical protein